MGRNNLAIMSVAEGKTGTVIIIEHTVSVKKKKRNIQMCIWLMRYGTTHISRIN